MSTPLQTLRRKTILLGCLLIAWALAGAPARAQLISTVVGNGTAGFSGDGGPATSAQLSSPTSIAFDRAGNLYIAEQGNNRVRKVAPNGIITTVAGNGIPTNTGDGGPATSASIYSPNRSLSVAVDERGNLFIGADNVVRKVSSEGIITTVAGNYTSGYSGDGGPATQASLGTLVSDVAVDKQGNLFIADRGNNRIRRVDSNGIITTVAGNGSFGYSGDDGPATSAQVVPEGLAIDASGTLFIAHQSYTNRFSSQNQHIRKVDAQGIITTVAGDRLKIAFIFSGDGGPATQATLSGPRGIAFNAGGNLFFGDYSASRVRWINANGIINTIVGNGYKEFDGDGKPATQAAIDPADLAFDSQGRLYIADQYNNRIRRVDLNLPVYVIGNGIASPQTGTVGTGVSIATAYAFSDPEGRALTYSSSSLPDGLSINPSTGLITGTPTRAYPFGVTIGATDDAGNTVYSGFYLTIQAAAGSPQVVGAGIASPQSATVGTGVSIATAYAFSDPEGRALTYSSSSLPAGLSLNATTGVISGVPINPGTAGITVGVTNGNNVTVYSGFFLTIQAGAGSPQVVGSGIASPQSATVGVGVSIATAYAFSEPAGRPLRYSSSSLPAGLSLNATTGVISGVPVNPGTVGITIGVTNDNNVTVYSGFLLIIERNPNINQPPQVVGSGIASPQSATVGVSISIATAYAFRDPEGRALTYSSSSLPDGLSINPSTGVISGTPTRAYPFGVTIGATDDGGSTIYSGFFLTVVNPGGGRLSAEGGRGLQVRALGNPVTSDQAQLEVSGVTGQRVWLRSYDSQGRQVGASWVEQAGEQERIEVRLGQPSGVYYVRVATGSEQHTLKIIKP